ncbi:DUF456 family protein [Viridibacillus sp. FSL R5-0477]|uniref:DUF456 domain-containing protein n=1 Tax=Viridibacillus arenosi FSL R5-213 TaxID=1227360 RepID=W4EQK2_9BACL|nr:MULTISPECIES: DUF456 family protein [Viridibacillus]ETT82282.1 hypothetical protein C176_14867 [Viridibacillus arenosi FSL R5-213]OMC83660.1 hypothetical protein BK128_18295 [Viridibacillus sp. FSL H7-0596]OMC85267.1 hypothetical protein BK130_00410 [Viridibacillus sp. FSL H8-0123]OMC92616.1 hypothetical protein BK137_06130 [Viridibacillus arenosi]
MDVIAWILIILSFIIAFVGLVYPIIPSVLFILLGFILYGAFYSFGDLPWWFWVIQILFVALLFGADTLANAFGVKKFGGSNAGMWGSTIGLLIGPFVIPIAGILLGPFLGAVLAELIVNRSSVKQAIRTGIGSLVGFLTSIITKGIIQIIMIVIFVIVI